MHDDKRTLADLRKKLGIIPIRTSIQLRQLRFLGHQARLPPERLDRQMLHAWLTPEIQQHTHVS
eukprot:16431266-Heterocapsa_arctica.AAC.1